MDSVQVTNVIIHAHDFNLPLASFSPLWKLLVIVQLTKMEMAKLKGF